jgi:hypothetical protein
MADKYYNRYVPAIGKPQNCAASVEGTAGVVHYKYQISAYNWNGETLSCDVLTINTGNATLSTSNYNELQWDLVEGADGYCISGRVDNSTYGLLYKAQASDFIMISGTRVGWNDQGQNTPNPSIQPASTDTTGRENWDALLFRANKALQSSELNEMQSISDNYMNSLGRAFFAEGGIIRGCSPTMADDGLTITIPEGEVFIKGKVRPIQSGVVTIHGTGSEMIGLLVTENIITHTDDTALTDPAVGAYNFEKDGAHRRTYTFTWTANNADSVKVFSIDNGAIIVASSETDYSKFNQLLATRTYEESGNYVVDDTPVLIKDNTDDTAKLDVCISALKAYVQGYRILRTKGSVLSLDKARVVKNIPEEQFDFSSGTAAGNFIYPLAKAYVAEVNQLFATVRGTDSITKGSPHGQDFIHDSLVDIISVTQGIVTYQAGVDFVKNGYTVDWSPVGLEPVTGTSYTVVYTYRKQLVEGVRTKTTVTNEAVIRGGTPNTGDNLAHSDIISITSVSSLPSGGGTVYQENMDWYMVDGQGDNQIATNGQVQWNLPGPEPAGGSTYYVSYSYWTHGTEGDYVTAHSYDSYNDITTYGNYVLRDCIDFRHPAGWSGSYPENDNVNIDYDYYLPRRDLIEVNTDGELILVEGTPDVLPARPKVQENCMAIAELYVHPWTYNYQDVDVTKLEIKRSTMEDIKVMDKRISTLEYFQTLDLLEQKAIDEYTVDAKTGVLVDNFQGSSRADVYFDRGGVTFGVAFDAVRGCIQTRTPFDAIDLKDNIDTLTTSTRITGKSVTLRYTDVLCQEQPYASQKVNVTPFLVFPWTGSLSLNPSEDYWTDTTQAADLRVSSGVSADEMSYWSNNPAGWEINATAWETHITGVQTVRTNNKTGAVITDRRNVNGRRVTDTTTEYGYNDRQVTSLSLTPESTTTSMGDRILDTSVVGKIRSRIVTVTGQKYRPNTELALKMEDIVIPMVPISPTVAGTHTGCVMSDDTGFFSARYTIPKDTFNVGEREVKVYNYNGLSEDETYATAVYNAFGISETRQSTYLTSNYLQPKVTTSTQTQKFAVVTAVRSWKQDPLAQTIYYPTSFFITKVGLFFASKDPTLPCTMEIRTVDNGYPSDGILSSVTLYPGDIHVSDDATAETIAVLPDPVFFEKEQWYAIVIKADTQNFNMWVATMGGTDVTSGGLITKQTNDGVLFRSSNGVTWVADPTSDLKFNLYRAEFETSGNLVFNTFTGIGSSIFNLTSTDITPGDGITDITTIDWQMDDAPTSSYLRTLKTNETSYVGSELANVKIRGTLATNNTWLSPVINTEKLGLTKAKYETGTKSYITRNVDLSPGTFDFFKIIYEINKPTNTNIRLYYSFDNGYSWTEIVSPTSTAAIDDFWTEFQYITANGDFVDQTQFRIRIDLISTTTGTTPRVRKLRVIAY